MSFHDMLPLDIDLLRNNKKRKNRKVTVYSFFAINEEIIISDKKQFVSFSLKFNRPFLVVGAFRFEIFKEIIND